MVARIKSGMATRSYVGSYCALTTYFVFLCRISLSENYNFCNKAIFGKRMMARVRTAGHMADEIFSDKNRTAEEGSMTKILFYDVLRQTRKTGAICSVDAENCYDRVAHAIVSLIFQSYGIPLTAAKTMLTAIQEMKFYLRTAFGDSKDFVRATLEIKTQGLCQENGAAPAGWAVVSITILSAHKRKGHGAKLVFPLFNTRAGTLSAVLYVDDSDVIHLNMTEDEEVEVTHESLQESIWNWGQLLQATGGALKGSKCFFHLISFGFQADGT